MKEPKDVEWPEDPVVDEVRTIRAKMWKEGGGTVAGFLEIVRIRTMSNESKKQPATRHKRSSTKKRKSRSK